MVYSKLILGKCPLVPFHGSLFCYKSTPEEVVLWFTARRTSFINFHPLPRCTWMIIQYKKKCKEIAVREATARNFPIGTSHCICLHTVCCMLVLCGGLFPSLRKRGSYVIRMPEDIYYRSLYPTSLGPHSIHQSSP